MELTHKYGPQVHILNSPFLNGLLAELCSPKVFQPQINQLVERLYTHLVAAVVDQEFPTLTFSEPTRMTGAHPDQRVTGIRPDADQKAVTVNLARAGTFPSHICYQFLHYALKPEKIRQDHIFAARVTNSAEKVTGADFGGMKIGGDIDDAIVLLPDPMGATGNTMVTSIEHYKNVVPGKAKKFIALNLIITPEYLRNLLRAHPDAHVYALRLDRGLSSHAVLNSVPGEHWDQERGLNDKQYIVPGGGGFGEIMNNSFV